MPTCRQARGCAAASQRLHGGCMGRHMPACTGAKREKRRNGAMAAGNGYIAFSHRGPFACNAGGHRTARGPQRLCGGSIAQAHARLHGSKAGEVSKRSDDGGGSLLRVFSQRPVCPHVGGCRTACGPQHLRGGSIGGSIAQTHARLHGSKAGETTKRVMAAGSGYIRVGAFIPNAAGCGGASKRWENAQPQNEFCEKTGRAQLWGVDCPHALCQPLRQ